MNHGTWQAEILVQLSGFCFINDISNLNMSIVCHCFLLKVSWSPPCMFVCVCVFMYARVCLYVHMCVYSCAHVCVYVHACIVCVCVCARVCMSFNPEGEKEMIPVIYKVLTCARLDRKHIALWCSHPNMKSVKWWTGQWSYLIVKHHLHWARWQAFRWLVQLQSCCQGRSVHPIDVSHYWGTGRSRLSLHRLVVVTSSHSH